MKKSKLIKEYCEWCEEFRDFKVESTIERERGTYIRLRCEVCCRLKVKLKEEE